MALIPVVPVFDVNGHNRQRSYRTREDPLELDDEQFYERFKAKKETFYYILHLVERDLERTKCHQVL